MKKFLFAVILATLASTVIAARLVYPVSRQGQRNIVYCGKELHFDLSALRYTAKGNVSVNLVLTQPEQFGEVRGIQLNIRNGDTNLVYAYLDKTRTPEGYVKSHFVIHESIVNRSFIYIDSKKDPNTLGCSYRIKVSDYYCADQQELNDEPASENR